MNTVHPTALVGPGVELGNGNVIGPQAVLIGPLVLGDGNWIGPGVVIGGPPEVRGFTHTATWDGPAGRDEPGAGAGIRIGNLNVFREYVLISQGWKSETVIGSSCFVMNKVYIAHDCELSDGVTMAGAVSLGGHVRVGAGANLGMGAQVHQRRVVGPGTMVGMGTVVTRDIPPHAKAFGVPARIQGVNVTGLQRASASAAAIAWLEDLYSDAAAHSSHLIPSPEWELIPEDLRVAFRWWTDAVGG